MKLYIALLPIALLGACKTDTDVRQDTATSLSREQAKIEAQLKSARLTRFFIADSTDLATLELNATDEGTRKLKQLSGLYQDGTLKGARTASFTKLYAAFVAEQSRNANIRQFRRETAEKIMAQSADMSLTDKAYYTNELITYRSDDVKLIGKSITALKDKLPAESHAQMVAKAQQLFDQYEAHFQKERIEYSRKQGETYQERAIYALNRVWAEQGMAVVRESRQLL